MQRADQYRSEFQLCVKRPKPDILSEILSLLQLKEILSLNSKDQCKYV